MRVGDRLAEDLAPRAGDGADAREHGVAGEAVGRDPVAGAHDPEERAGDREPRGRSAAGGGGEGGEVEGVVEDAGVDRVRPGGRRASRVALRSHEVALGRRRGRAPRRPVRVVAAQPDERLEQRRARRGERRASRARRGRGACPVGRGLALAGRQQDQHAASVGSARPDSWLGSRNAEQPCGQGPDRAATASSAQEMRDGVVAIQRELEVAPDFPARGRAGGRRGRRRAPAARRSTAPTSSSSRSTPTAAHDLDQAMHIERDRRAATSSTTRSPTSPPSSPPATPSTSRPTAAARRSTAPTPRSRCTRPC